MRDDSPDHHPDDNCKSQIILPHVGPFNTERCELWVFVVEYLNERLVFISWLNSFFLSSSALLQLQGEVYQPVLPPVLRPGPGRSHYPAGIARSHHGQRGDHGQTETPAGPGLHPGEL